MAGPPRAPRGPTGAGAFGPPGGASREAQSEPAVIPKGRRPLAAAVVLAEVLKV